MPHTRWVTVRQVTALVLMAVFFAGAAATSAGLIVGSVKVLGFAGQLRGRAALLAGMVAIAMCLGGIIVGWSILPRFDRFEPPGPLLDPARYPRLHREIARVAAMTGEAPPVEVYLLPDVNAFVAERGGLLGIGAKRVMGVGLALLQVLTVSELRAVLVHEFGHLVGGDAGIGRWLYRARSAIGRTLENLGDASHSAGGWDTGLTNLLAWFFHLIATPFQWFGLFFLRFTRALGRAQEYAADALAVRLEGQRALIEGLKKSEAAGLAWSSFVEGELLPLVELGLAPPVGKGFRQFLDDASIAAALTRSMTAQLRASAKADAFDSHPPLKDRLAYAEALRGPSKPADEQPAVDLLGEVRGLELALLRRLSKGKPLEPIAWADSGPQLAKAWRREARALAKALAGLTPRELPRDAATLRARARHQLGPRAATIPTELLRAWAASALGVGLFALLLDHGFEPHNSPGKPVRFVRGSEAIEPRVELERYLDGTLDAEAWAALWNAVGLADVELGKD